jgi:hypothetical protein
MKAVFSLLFLLLFSMPSYGDLHLVTVQSKKIHYLPDEKAVLLGTVENTGSLEANATVHCELVRKLDETIPLPVKTITIPPKSKAAASFEYPLGGVVYGYEVCMWLDGENKRMREYFGVSRNVIEIGIFGNSPYQNYIDLFAWAPDNFGNLSPKEDSWWAGQTNVLYTKKDLTARMDAWHDKGIKTLTYIIPSPGGPPGIDLLVSHPDWACYNRFGQLGGLFMALDVWTLKNWTVNQHRNAKGEPWYFWNCWTVNFYDPETVKYGAQAIVNAADMFGWEGIRFDSQFDIFGGYSVGGQPTDHGENRVQLNARNLRLTKERIKSKYPDFLFGYNYGSVQPQPTAMDSVVCEGGGLIMDEGFCNTSDPQDPDNPWRNFSRRVIREVENTGRLGGCQIVFEFNRGAVPVISDNDYGLSFCFAGGGRPYVWNFPSTRYRLDRFATRYSEYLMNNEIARLKKPDDIFTVAAPGEVWWRDWAAFYRAKDGRGQYILHLFNAPVKEGIGSTPFPVPQKDIRIGVKLPAGQEMTGAWLLSPEPEVHGEKLDPIPGVGGVTLKVGNLDIWNMLIITVRGGS